MPDTLPTEPNNKKPVKNNRRVIVISLAVTVLLGSAIGIYLQKNRNNIDIGCSVRKLQPSGVLPETKNIIVGEITLHAEIASTDQQKQLGLSGRNCLEPGTAMLFPYETEDFLCFWMKDMRFPIDMIWLDEDKRVVTIRSDVTPDTFPTTFCPERPARYVVETQAGLAKRHSWSKNTQFTF